MSNSSPPLGDDEPEIAEDDEVIDGVDDEIVDDEVVDDDVVEDEVAEVIDERPWWRRSPQEWGALLRTWPGLLSIAIAVTVIGSWLPWSFEGPVRLGGLEGSHDGWLAVLAAAAAIGTVRGVRRGSWPPIVIALICGTTALYFVLRDRPPPDAHIGWGWFVALVGALGMTTAAVGSIVSRLTAEPDARWVRQPF